MRWAIFSDIHGNLEALQAVLADIEKQAPEAGKLCLGDVVGYGASPNECIELVRRCGAEALLGNHDQVAAGLTAGEEFNEAAQEAIFWTRDRLTPDSRDWLRALPWDTAKETFRAVHSAPRDPGQFDYILSPHDALLQFRHFTEQDCFFGHSHYPGLFMDLGDGAESLALDPNKPLTLHPRFRYLINVGSVGQPRDNDPRAGWLLYDAATRVVTLRRVEYDVQGAQRKILQAGLPAFLAFRLEVGG